VKLDMTKRGLGELEKRNAMGREGQGGRGTKKMRAEVESLQNKVDATGWSVDEEQARRHCAEQRMM